MLHFLRKQSSPTEFFGSRIKAPKGKGDEQRVLARYYHPKGAC